MIVKTKDKIVIKDELFNPKDILTCGQVFRYSQQDNKWIVISKDKKAEITGCNNEFIINGDSDYFYNYFDLDRNYNDIINAVQQKPLIEQSLPISKNIRILKQDPFETIISFIISANNLIPRIRGIIERLCTAIGEQKDGYYSFPTPQKMAEMDITFYTKIGAGYRDSYLKDTAQKIAQGEFDLNAPYYMSTEQAKKYLTTLKGVGPKVADCILLFAYGKYDVFPVDTWIKKLYFKIFPTSNPNTPPSTIRKELVALYGDYCGIAQQYLFYYLRESK